MSARGFQPAVVAYVSLIPALWRQKQADLSESKASLVCTEFSRVIDRQTLSHTKDKTTETQVKQLAIMFYAC